MDIYGDMDPMNLNDTLVGTDDPDTIFGGQGDDSIDGGAGADSLDGGIGNDTILAGPSDDGDTLNGGAGDDLYIVHGSSPTIVEAASGGTDTIQSDADYLNLNSYANVENGALTGSGYSSEVDGNALDNVLSTSASAEYGYLYGGDGNDSLYLNEIIGGNAYGGNGADSIAAYGSDGANAQIFGDAGADTLDAEEARGSTSLYGGDDGDSLYGEGGSDVVYGGGGDDYFRTLTGQGPDTIYGGAGTDLLTLERTDAAGPLHVDLTLSGLQSVGDGTQFSSIEQIRFAGGLGADFAQGGDLDDVLKGMAGDDTLIGGAGNDILQGGAGHDSLTGGLGADTFRFDGPTAGADDTVTDFTSGTDHVALSKAGFGITSVSDFDIVTAAGGPTEAKATLIVDTAAHTLSWDADGTGAGAATLLAHGAFTTNAGDYLVF